MYRALKVYPRKSDFLGVLDHTVQNKVCLRLSVLQMLISVQDVLTTLARMISIDESILNSGPS